MVWQACKVGSICPSSHPARKFLHKQSPEFQGDPGLGLFPVQDTTQLRRPGCTLCAAGHFWGRGAQGHVGHMVTHSFHPHLLWEEFSESALALPQPQSSEAPRIMTQETLNLVFVSFCFFEIPEASDSSSGIHVQKPCLTTHNPVRAFGQN